MQNKKVSVYLRNAKLCPASYYRIYQYLMDDEDCTFHNIASDKMFERNQTINRNAKTYIIWKAVYFFHMLTRATAYEFHDIINKPSVVIISRSILPHKSFALNNLLLRKILKNARKVYWDFDDDIFLNGEITSSEKNILLNQSSKIIVTHDYLASLLPHSEADSKICILPTTDGDFDRFIKNPGSVSRERESRFNEEINLVWVGQAVNLRYFDGIIEELDDYAEEEKRKDREVKLTVVCNQPLNVEVKYLIVENIKWTKKNALKAMCNAHIGIMPLKNEQYSLGKGGFKLVQYMSSGLPVVGSNVGYNTEVIKNTFGCLADIGSWKVSLQSLTKDMQIWKERSVNSREQWESSFSFNNGYTFWKELLVDD